jgi:hypothetical protein
MLPPSYAFGLPQGATVTAMAVEAGCTDPGLHAFLLETVAGEAAAAPEILVRFIPSALAPTKLGWAGKKLLRIKSATTPAVLALEGKKPAWAAAYAKVGPDGALVPTLAVLRADIGAQTFTTELRKFDGAGRFFSPLLLASGGGVAMLWGEDDPAGSRIVLAAVDAQDPSIAGKKTLAAGPMLDRFVALARDDALLVARLESTADDGECLDVVVEKFDLEGARTGGVRAAGVCGEAVLTGVRVKDAQTIVDGFEGRKGRMKPFDVKVDGGFSTATIEKRGSPSVPYDATFVAFSDVVFWKKRNDDSAATLEFYGKGLPVSENGASAPLALSLCGASAVGAWVHEGSGGKGVVRFFEIPLKDGDGDGILDAFDACPEGETAEDG